METCEELKEAKQICWVLVKMRYFWGGGFNAPFFLIN
jgi:hypothetical protein